MASELLAGASRHQVSQCEGTALRPCPRRRGRPAGSSLRSGRLPWGRGEERARAACPGRSALPAPVCTPTEAVSRASAHGSASDRAGVRGERLPGAGLPAVGAVRAAAPYAWCAAPAALSWRAGLCRGHLAGQGVAPCLPLAGRGAGAGGALLLGIYRLALGQ